MGIGEICPVIDWQPAWRVVWPLTLWMLGQGRPWLEKQKMEGWLHNEWQLKYKCRHRHLVLGDMTGPANETDPAGLKTEWLITLQARLDSQGRPDLTGVKMAATVTIWWLVWLPGPRPLWCWAGLSCLFKSPLPKGSRLFKKGPRRTRWGMGGCIRAEISQKYLLCAEREVFRH